MVYFQGAGQSEFYGVALAGRLGGGFAELASDPVPPFFEAFHIGIGHQASVVGGCADD